MGVEWDDVADAVNRASRAVARRYGSFTTFEDLSQSGYEFILARPGRMDHYELRDGTLYRNGLVSDLIAYLTKVAKRERAAVLGLQPGDQFHYDAQLVEAVLPGVWNAEYRPPVVEAAVRSTADPSTMGNWQAMVADVKGAVDQLPTRLQRVLLAYYGVGPLGGWREAAAALGMSKTAANDMGHQAISRTVDILNGVPDEDASASRQVTGVRRVQSNATARAVVQNQWEG